MYLSGPAVHGVEDGLGFSLLYLAKSFWGIAEDDGSHLLESAVSISFGCGLDDVGHILVKLQPLAPFAGWGPFNPLLRNYSAGIRRLWYMEGLGSVGCLLAGLLLRLTRFRTCCTSLSRSKHFILAWWIFRPRWFLHSFPQMHVMFVVCPFAWVVIMRSKHMFVIVHVWVSSGVITYLW